MVLQFLKNSEWEEAWAEEVEGEEAETKEEDLILYILIKLMIV